MSNSLHAADIAFHIHSQTNLSVHEQVGPTVMVRGEGIYTWDDKGKRYLDAMSGMWSAALGYSEERLTKAALRQMQELPYHQNFAHRSTEPAIQLAERLIQLAPVPMSKVLFACSGSEANDTAIKLAWYYWSAVGQPQRRKIISRNRAYHGTTVASASLTGLPHLHQDFGLPLPGFLHVTCPHYYREGLPGESEEAFSTRLADELEALILREGAETIAAFFAEPLMGTGGVITPPAGYFEKIQKVLKRHSILLVADEVICGFGRTGNWWGSQTYGLKPDMLTCAKALSASYLPISALMISEDIYQAMRSQSEKIGVFGHGYTYGGHPVPAAVALECLNIYLERRLPEHAQRVGARLGAGLRKLADHPLVGEVRGEGLMWGVELVADKANKTAFPREWKVGLAVSQQTEANGVTARSLNDSVVFAPPLIITEAEVDLVLEAFSKGLDATLDKLVAQSRFNR
ncbi:aspartate aminotransferase family protein [Pseudomonas hunanensis]|uniref:Aspartate aminotransferase family protein n=1 Tax=Pseudomonas hunanensis TaxID=1247546 RepID=A0ABD6N0S8_9PSED|nr:aspartate aminotransferase family protein [Pseudomonas hunanensis]NWL47436.1 aspartate aminotransferase family protein [Pseudomonas hunanensis]